MARSDRATTERASVSRLERADHGRVLSAEHRGARRRRAGPDHPDRRQLRAHELQRRPDADVVARASRARRARRAHRRRPREPRALWRPRLGDGAGLQPHDHAARVAARSRDAGAVGHRGFQAPVRARARRHVAARVRGRYADARGARGRGHRVHRARAASGEGVAAAGRRVAHDAGRSGPRLQVQAAVGQDRSICSSTTARPRRRSRSSGCSPTVITSSRA